MGLVCKYRTMCLKFWKKRLQKNIWAGFMAAKIYSAPRGGWVWEPSGDKAHGHERPRDRNTWISIENHGFPLKIIDFEQNLVPKIETKVIFGPSGLRGGVWTTFFGKSF